MRPAAKAVRHPSCHGGASRETGLARLPPCQRSCNRRCPRRAAWPPAARRACPPSHGRAEKPKTRPLPARARRDRPLLVALVTFMIVSSPCRRRSAAARAPPQVRHPVAPSWLVDEGKIGTAPFGTACVVPALASSNAGLCRSRAYCSDDTWNDVREGQFSLLALFFRLT